MTELARGRTLTGVVTAFDEAAGLGSISDANDVEYVFHCIEIADGTRRIDVGTPVSFDLLAKFGRYEAANIRT